MAAGIRKDLQYYKFCAYGFLKNLRFFDPFIVLFFREQGLSFLEIGSLISIREIAVQILEIPTGIMADAFGRRRTMVFSFAAYIVSFAVFYFLPGFATCALGMVFFAFGEAFRTGTHKAMIMEHLRLHGIFHTKVEYYGHTRSWSQYGSALSSLIAAALVFYAGNYSIVFLFSIGPYILNMLLMMSYPAALDGDIRTIQGENTVAQFAGEIRTTVQRSFTALRSRQALTPVLHMSLYSGVFKTVKDYLQPVLVTLAAALAIAPYMESEKRSALLIGALYTLLFVLSSFASRHAGSIRNIFGTQEHTANISFAAGMLTVAFSAFFLHWQTIWPAAGMFVMLYIMENLREPVCISIINDNVEPKITATVLSVESQLESLTTALLAPVMGLAADRLGLAAGLALMASFLLLVLLPLRIRPHKIQAAGTPQ